MSLEIVIDDSVIIDLPKEILEEIDRIIEDLEE